MAVLTSRSIDAAEADATPVSSEDSPKELNFFDVGSSGKKDLY